MQRNQKIGHFGENLAISFLKQKGYQVIGRNFKVRGGEIDVICEQGKQLVFVEVKTRTSNNFGYPEESFTYVKRQRFKTAVLAYLFLLKYPKKWQADLLSIEYDQKSKKAKIRHYQNVEL